MIPIQYCTNKVRCGSSIKLNLFNHLESWSTPRAVRHRSGDRNRSSITFSRP